MASLAALTLLLGCASSDYEAKGVAQGFKGEVDWLRESFGDKTAHIDGDEPLGPFPAAPIDPRPQVRSEKQRTDMIAALKADQATAAKIDVALEQGDRTQYLTLNGAKPTAQPIPVTLENLPLPDGVRDLDTVDPRQLGSWFAAASLEFPEGSSDIPDEAAGSLRLAAGLAADNLAARIIGYSSSERVTAPGRGLHETNRWLADLRARKVALALIKLGAPPAKLVVGAAPEAERNSGDKVEIIIDY